MSSSTESSLSSTTPPAIICPSLLSCDLANLNHDARQMLDYGSDWLHMDIMDGHFVPNLTFGPPVIASLRKAMNDYKPKNATDDEKKTDDANASSSSSSSSSSPVYIDCHLMVTEPYKWIEPLKKAGASGFTFHLESVMPEGGVSGMIRKVRDAGMKVGIVIKPGTPVEEVFPYCNDVDLILIMTVEPGFSGQAFMGDMMPKVRALRDKFPSLNIQVDGGLSPSTIDQATAAGANVIVAASAIFGSNDRQGVIKRLRSSVEESNKKRELNCIG